MAEVVSTKERRLKENPPKAASKEELEAAGAERKQGFQRLQVARDMVGTLKNRKWSTLTSNEKDKILSAAAVALGLVAEG